MPYLCLLLAIVFEVAGTTCMKLSDGLRYWRPAMAMGVFYLASFVFVALAIRRIEVSIGYAIWSALGTALIAVIGIAYFKEHLSTAKVAGLVLIIAGVLALHVSDWRHKRGVEGSGPGHAVSLPEHAR